MKSGSQLSPTLWSGEGGLYWVVCLDLYWRLMVGWALSSEWRREFVEQAFLMGEDSRGGSVSPLVHADGGSPSARTAFRERLAADNCQQGMSRTGHCWDTAVAESFFSVLKCEMVPDEHFAARQEAKDQLFDYIEVFANRSWIHSATGYLAPAE
jgi:putative transposase